MHWVYHRLLPERCIRLPKSQILRFEKAGVHAAAFTALILALRRRGAWRGGAVEGESLFPPTDGNDLAASLMFAAEQRSLS